MHDREPYLTKTADGKLLKSSTIFIRNDEGKPVGILGINFDITLMKLLSARSMPLPASAARATPSPSPLPKTSATCSKTCCASANSLWASPRRS